MRRLEIQPKGIPDLKNFGKPPSLIDGKPSLIPEDTLQRPAGKAHFLCQSLPSDAHRAHEFLPEHFSNGRGLRCHSIHADLLITFLNHRISF